MDLHLERGLRLNTAPEYKSLYSWAINEIDAQGRQVGDDQRKVGVDLDLLPAFGHLDVLIHENGSPLAAPWWNAA